MTTQIAQLKTEILFLESEIARVEEETRIAKQIRKEEHEVFVQSKKDHEEVIGAINTALEALSGQYGFLQISSSHQHKHKLREGQPALGSTPFESYKSGTAGAGSAMEMLEDLLERYSTALAELIADENAARRRTRSYSSGMPCSSKRRRPPRTIRSQRGGDSSPP